VARAAVSAFGRIEILVNNAGRGLLGAVEEASPDEVEAVFQTNVFGLLAVTRAVLPVMRAQRSGRILNLSSMGGFAQVAGWGVYGATKFAVEGLSEALRAEVEPLGIQVVIVEPGSFRTNFLDGSSLQTASQVIDDYAATTGQLRGGDPA
jgi:NAD(P)-dependent dehydrogenase (short-subunit alcohol dehydrogenase family)